MQNIVSRKGSSKILTFSTPHVLKAIQLLSDEKFVSRSTFCKELHLGEGAVKTLISHFKESKIADTAKAGTFLTEKGTKLAKEFEKTLTNECNVKKCKIAQKKHNHAIILKNYANQIKTGLEQRDYAILYGSEGCVTMIFKNERFTFPDDDKDCLSSDKKTKKILLTNLEPDDNDVIIISSSDDPFVAEVSAKNSALWTMATS